VRVVPEHDEKSRGKSQLETRSRRGDHDFPSQASVRQLAGPEVGWPLG
jgi:hypothetical protein